MLEDPVKTAPFDSLHRVIAKPADLSNIENRYDVSVMEPSGSAGLVQESAAGGRVRCGVDAQNLEGHRAVEANVHSFVDGSHSSPTELAHHTVTRDSPARLDAVIEPPTAAAARASGRPHANQPVNDLQALKSRSNVVFEARISRRELVAVRRLALLGGEQVQLDRLADPIVIVARFGDGLKIGGNRHR
jgi:hypothetical protein